MSKNQRQNEREFLDEIRLSQGLGLWRATSHGTGVVATAIILVLLGGAIIAAGQLTPLAILLAALLVVVNNLGYVELALRATRSGGAYPLVYRGQENASLAFLSGWALALSGLGLCGLLAQAAAHHLSLLLADLLSLIVPASVLGMGLVALVALQSCLGGRIGRRLPLTLPLVILLLILILLATPRLPPGDYGKAYSQPYPAMTLLLASFIGMEIIAGHQGELRRRTTNLPQALLGTPVLAAMLSAALAMLAGSHIGEMAATPLVPLGRAIAGATGQAVMAGIALGALILSLDHGLTMVVRHLYVMSGDGFWPAELRHTHPRRGMPVRMILVVSLLILPIVWVPVELLSQVSGLLYLATLMTVNLTLALRPRRPARRTFALPFHPWVPALTLAVDLLVISLWRPTSIAWAVCCVALGSLVYLAYGRRHRLESQEGVAVFRPPTEKRAPEAFRVLVPIANPATAKTLLRTAGRLTQAQNGEVLALQIIVVPESMPLEAGRRRAQDSRKVLENALALANEEGFPVQTMTRVARSVPHGILDAAADEGADIIVLGWRTPTRARAASLGAISDAVLRDAQCDVLVVRRGDASTPGSILVPTAGGSHAHTAAGMALLLAETSQSEVTLLCVQPGPATTQQMEENRCLLTETATKLATEHPLQQKVVQASSVVEGIVQEARQHDLLMLGVSEESLLDQIMFGSIPLQVAARVPATILVQAHRGLTGLWIRRLIHALQDALPILSREEILEVQQEMVQGAQPGTDYSVLIVLSCIIATLGLLQSSPAVVIGAMLVAPLMSPIMAFSLGLVRGDLRLIRFATEAILMGSIVREAAQKQAVQEILAEFAAARGSRLVDLEITPRKADLLIIATLQSTELFDHETVNEVQTVLSAQLGNPVQLEIVILPTVRSTPPSLP